MVSSVYNALNALPQQPDVILIARSGQDLSRFNLQYSHVGFAVRQQNTWEVIHLLNQCSSNSSDLYKEGLVNFFGDAQTKALIVIPSLSLQQALKKQLLETAQSAQRLHNPHYSLVAYPFATDYQNSNQWVLEVIALGLMSPEASVERAAVQNWLKTHQYQPSVLYMKIHERLAAKFILANAQVSDHPMKERLGGSYSVVTVDSIVKFLEAQDQVQQILTVTGE